MERRYIVYLWHRDNSTGVIELGNADKPHKVIELGQWNMRKQGLSDGITWQLHSGDFVSALVAASKLSG